MELALFGSREILLSVSLLLIGTCATAQGGRRRRGAVGRQCASARHRLSLYLVRRAAHATLEGLVEHLAERRVRVHGHRELAQVDAVLDGVGHLLDEVGGVQPHDVARDDLGRVLAEDDLARGGEASSQSLGGRGGVTPRAGAGGE